MSTDSALYRLMTWLSPSYPVGAYAFSHGIENAVERGFVHDRDTALEWIRELVLHGNGRADLVFLKEAWEARGDTRALDALARYAVAFQTTSELRTESVAQGRAFGEVSRNAWQVPELDAVLDAVAEAPAYPVVVGAVAAAHDVARESSMLAFAHAFAANLVSAAVRLVPLGQTDGQRMTAALERDVTAAVSDAGTLTRHTVSNATIVSEICSMNHETQYTRLFRS
jgi:urease accessory protein